MRTPHALSVLEAMNYSFSDYASTEHSAPLRDAATNGSSPILRAMIDNDPSVPLPTPEVMHLPPDTILKHVKRIEDFPRLLRGFIDELDSKDPACKISFDTVIREDSSFSPYWRNQANMQAGPDPVDNESLLCHLHKFRGAMAAALASHVASHSTIFQDPGFMKWVPSIHNHTASVTVGASLVGSGPTFEAKKAGLELITKLGLSTIVVHDFEAISAPLNGDFPIEAFDEVATEGIDFPWLGCKMDGRNATTKHWDASCSSSSAFHRPTSGRLTGVDGNPVSQLLRKAVISPPAPTPPRMSESVRNKISFLYQRAWGKAEEADASFVVLNGGNKRIYGIRQRSTQTLYVSRPLSRRDASFTFLDTAVIIAAFGDVLDRALQMNDLLGAGELPAASRRDHMHEPGKNVEALLEVSQGYHLPSSVLRNDYQWDFVTFESMVKETAMVEILWEPGDAFSSVLRKLSSPLVLSRSPESVVPGSSLRVKVHSRMPHGVSTFLCHLVQSDGIPYGAPFVMKISPDDEGKTVQWTDSILQILAKDSTHQGIVPRSFGATFSDNQSGAAAFFMEYFAGAHVMPLHGSTNAKTELRSRIEAWLRYCEQVNGIHRRVDAHDILYYPDCDTRFHVVGWKHQD
ncbi:hypothetical protein BDZ89DRAFT_1145980 [Hymenopellis radicata]|nr:hypothetical protein BDZ89DRAFT_1145980 [Hymenopellis radicata]